MPYMYTLKVKKFRVCAYLRLDSIKENIEGDANFHHPPPRNRVNAVLPVCTTNLPPSPNKIWGMTSPCLNRD